MRKLAIYLLVTIFCSGVAVPAALSHGKSQGNHHSGYKEKKSSKHKAAISWKQGKHQAHHKKPKPHKARYRPQAKGKYYAPRHPVYYGHSKKYHSKKRSHKPKYVYLKPHKGPRHYGHYGYRGFYWPFANVRIVINLSNRQIERHHKAVYSALEAPVGAVVNWHDRGRHGSIVIIREGVDSRGHLCKEYRQTISYGGRVSIQTVVSCLTSDGYWVTL